jgi:guanine deaminase
MAKILAAVQRAAVSSGLADMRGMLDRSVSVGIGTDGANCSDNLNLYEDEATQLASLVSKAQGPDRQRSIETHEALRAATEGSARALGSSDEIGRMAPGRKADIVFLDLGHVNWVRFNEPVNQLVHTEDGNAVHSVMAGGRMIVESCRLLTVVPSRLARLNRDNRKLCDRLARIVGAHCPGLAKTPLHVHRYGANRPC